ncbi:DgyrCDS7386 [Dimorphilus gyrociliatus]|uniref:Tyrosine--tRNA ligase n=1 Tax=Dimorphilus gyrociliatus TaxID=2664684 RepID=A0A7I8VRU2_9ANNE|nr:DgyrCDS7386 [Dimorphilus gyrociliatus]
MTRSRKRKRNELEAKLSSPQCFYLGIDPTASSLHIGNLLPLIALLHCQRAGHNAVVLIGGATAQIGDPSGKNSERNPIDKIHIRENVSSIRMIIEKIQKNFDDMFQKDNPGSFTILNNEDWYSQINLVEFLSTYGRHFRMGPLLSRETVQTRLKGEQGLSLCEFTYQIFQSYDWFHLMNKYNCYIQIGGNDQTGNIVSGYEFIQRVKKDTVFGLTVPLITDSSGAKLGKSAGNSVWLDGIQTSAYELYQFFINLPDDDMERMLSLFTFLPIDSIKKLINLHLENPSERMAQKKLAVEVVKLVHGEVGVEIAEKYSAILFGKNEDVAKMIGDLDGTELQNLFKNASTTQIQFENGMKLSDICMAAKCFKRNKDADRIIRQGGVKLNEQKVLDPEYRIDEASAILKNGISVIKVGKKKYYIIEWFPARS